MWNNDWVFFPIFLKPDLNTIKVSVLVQKLMFKADLLIKYEQWFI